MENTTGELPIFNDSGVEETEVKLDGADVPDEIKDALKVIVGNRPDSFIQEFDNQSPEPQQKGLFSSISSSSLPQDETARDRFIKKGDRVREAFKLRDNRIYVLDLTSPQDLKKYSDLMDEIFDGSDRLSLAEDIKEPKILLDPNSPVGYRAIVTLRVFRLEREIKPKRPEEP